MDLWKEYGVGGLGTQPLHAYQESCEIGARGEGAAAHAASTRRRSAPWLGLQQGQVWPAGQRCTAGAAGTSKLEAQTASWPTRPVPLRPLQALRLFELPSFAERGALATSASVRALAGGPGGLLMAGEEDGKVRVWRWKPAA